MQAPHPPPIENDANSSEPDVLSGLHKMSRTAGLGSQEYVAVNSAAVASVFIGLLSALAVSFGAVLLFIPVVAIVVGILAIRQIRRSAGTQTGVGIAVLGMLLALGFVATIGGRALLAARDENSQASEIAAVIDKLGQDLNKADYDAAWNAFGPRLQERTRKEDFVNFWTRAQSSELYGRIKAMHNNGLVEISKDPNTDEQIAHTVMILELEHGTDRRQTTLYKMDGRWLIEDMSVTFGPAAPAAPGAAEQQ